ncbi:ABC transporter ATP-binding protein [Leptolyngbya sp. FACHB-711]|uniref:ABC transporter ATP-binding protein n=1 Tax=Leptolyngbya sp. FACHB-711 TaxID=2692813 RepID=UPI001683F1D8|nr:ABC transporter ATP-binding protein [Leptolyngbya sp. FACHB-711]MBD2023263.1 ABC transporter ATP-binding protein [Leptolyngbya sp. FACHB-711]
MTRLLDVRNLNTRFFTPGGIVHAVNGVSFHVDEGEALGIVGESGSGKSVTMLSIMGLLSTPPKHSVTGEVRFGNRNLLQLNRTEMRNLRGSQIAMIFQDPMTSLNPVLRIERQMTEAIQQHLGLNSAEAKARAIALLQRVGIPGAKERICSYPHQFSGGMRQRVMIAMGLACNPKLLIADEPTTALDVTIQAQIVELLKQLKQELQMAVLWITHDLSLLAGFADRIMVMYAGQIVEQAPLHQLYRNPRHPYTIGLLQSIPRLDEQRERLKPIEGVPPSLVNYPKGCPFAPRCPFAIAICHTEDPPLESVGDHQVACWVKPSEQDVLQSSQPTVA